MCLVSGKQLVSNGCSCRLYDGLGVAARASAWQIDSSRLRSRHQLVCWPDTVRPAACICSSRPRPTGYQHTPSRTMYSWMAASASTMRCTACLQEGKHCRCSVHCSCKKQQQVPGHYQQCETSPARAAADNNAEHGLPAVRFSLTYHQCYGLKQCCATKCTEPHKQPTAEVSDVNHIACVPMRSCRSLEQAQHLPKVVMIMGKQHSTAQHSNCVA
jgi:hypothetical protein